jgi:PAP2 superfamily
MASTLSARPQASRTAEQHSPRGRNGPERLDGRREVLILVAAWLVYFGIRAISEGRASVARAHAHTLLQVEQNLGIAWERDAQHPVTQHHWLLTAANWVYVWGHWPVIAGVALWLFRRHAPGYRELRLAFLLSGAIGVVIFALFPVAPPRLADLGLLDSVTRYSHAYRALQPRALTNIYAAFPSLHFGWDLLVGLALYRHASWRALRLAGLLTPVAMALAVVVTANHFVIDVPAGGAVALTGLYAARRILRRAEGTPCRQSADANARPTECA